MGKKLINVLLVGMDTAALQYHVLIYTHTPKAFLIITLEKMRCLHLLPRRRQIQSCCLFS